MALKRFLLAVAAALAFASAAEATGTVRIEWLRNGLVYSAENVTSSGVSAQSGAAPDFGSATGQALITPLAGAVVVTLPGTSPTATQTNGRRLQIGSGSYTVPVTSGQKIAVIESTDAVVGVGGSGSGGDASASNQTTQITAEQAIQATLGAKADGACATDTGTCSAEELYKRALQRYTTMIANWGSSADAAYTGAGGSLASYLRAIADSGLSTTPVAVTGTLTGTNSLTPGTGTANCGKAEDQASADGDVTCGALFIQQPVPANTAGATGDYVYGQMNAGGLWVSPLPQIANGLTNARVHAAATTNATSVKGTAGQLYAFHLCSGTANNKYLKLYNKATAPTVGTDTPVATITIPGNGCAPEFTTTLGVVYGTGLAYAITGAETDADTTAVAAGDVDGFLAYK